MRMDNSSWTAAKILLSAASPIQNFFDHGGATHYFINRQAAEILHNDDMKGMASFIVINIDNINRGTSWADKGWKCFAHYYNPFNHAGLNPWPGALDECSHYFNLACDNWTKKCIRKSMFFLGAASHIVQDLCVPYHSMCVPFNGHQKYEKWVKNNYFNYKAGRGGTYTHKSIDEIIHYNAIVSSKYYHYLNVEEETSYHIVTALLVPLAQKTTAGLFHLFLNTIKYQKALAGICVLKNKSSLMQKPPWIT